jgi:outer membrane protein OmpA-like peptidoglycan-associated protein
VFRTVADEARDQPAANSIMGHADESMAAVYRERIGDDRLRAVANHVQAWLFPDTVVGSAGSAKPAKSRADAKPDKAAAKRAPAKDRRASAAAVGQDEPPLLRIVG